MQLINIKTIICINKFAIYFMFLHFKKTHLLKLTNNVTHRISKRNTNYFKNDLSTKHINKLTQLKLKNHANSMRKPPITCNY